MLTYYPTKHLDLAKEEASHNLTNNPDNPWINVGKLVTKTGFVWKDVNIKLWSETFWGVQVTIGGSMNNTTTTDLTTTLNRVIELTKEEYELLQRS